MFYSEYSHAFIGFLVAIAIGLQLISYISGKETENALRRELEAALDLNKHLKALSQVEFQTIAERDRQIRYLRDQLLSLGVLPTNQIETLSNEFPEFIDEY